MWGMCVLKGTGKKTLPRKKGRSTFVIREGGNRAMDKSLRGGRKADDPCGKSKTVCVRFKREKEKFECIRNKETRA